MGVNWYEWCRLCARSGDQNINLSTESSTNISTINSIGKYFWVNIKSCDLNKYVCQDCFGLVNLLVTFTERVNKVQAMFLMLQSTKSGQLDPYEVRSQFDLLDEDWEHIIKCERKGNDLEYDQEIEIVEENDQMEVTYCEMGSKDNQKVDNFTAHCTQFDYDSDIKDDTDFKDDKKQLLGNVETRIEDEIKMSSEESEEPEKREKRSKYTEKNLEKKHSEEDHMEIGGNDNHEETVKEQKQPCRDDAVPKLKRNLDQSESIESSNATKYRCKSCGKNYKNATSYRKHLEIHNLVSDLPDFMCHECGKVLATERQLRQHKRTHLPLEEKLTVQCPHCDKKYINEAVMKHHVVHIHSKQSFVCEECGVTLKRLSSLKDHKLTHSNILAFKCESCDKGFKNKARLKAHMDAVHSTTTYQCSQCELTLNSKRTLKMHMLVHTNEKGYKCNFCGAAFKRGKSLKNHLIIHIGLRPYKCNFCDKTFTNGSNCRAHKKKIHPLELEAEEAAGSKNESTIVPNLYELRASESVQEPRSSVRSRGGIAPKMRALLDAAEHLESTEESFVTSQPKSANKRVQHFKFDKESSEFQEVTELVAENNSECFEQEIENETIVFEVIDEEDL